MAATATASRVESLVGNLAAVRAPRGTERECQGWHQEAALRSEQGQRLYAQAVLEGLRTYLAEYARSE